MPRRHRWEAPLSLLLALLCLVPYARVPAAALLLCFLPGVAICRHRLRETETVRLLALGGLLSLCSICAVGIPAALLAGRPGRLLAVATACAITWSACLIPGRPRPQAASDPVWTRRFAILAAVALLMQIGMSWAMYPSATDGGAASVRWRGMPDLFFFHGIHTQLAERMPPMDPERGDALLVHNWIYHFHFALVQVASELSVPAMQRLVSAWTALMLLAMVFLICRDLFGNPAAGLLACALVITSAEAAWLIRSLAHLSLDLSTMGWVHSPLGITLLFGWYNLPPLIGVLAVWYFFAQSRTEKRISYLWISVCMAAVVAFFHPVFYGVFMIGFCLWLARLALAQGFQPAWLAYLATPLPFFLLYKLPYYGMASPPQVIHAMGGPGAVVAQAKGLMLVATSIGMLGGIGLLVARGAGPAAWVIGASLALRLAVRSPNPHWFTDLIYLFGSIAAGLGAAWLWRRWRAAGAITVAVLLAAGAVSFALHLRGALDVRYTFSQDERDAAAWLSANTTPGQVVTIHPNSPSSFTVLGLAGRRVLHGWTTHQLDFHHDALLREAQVAELFRTTEPGRAAELSGALGTRLIYIGPTEKSCCGREGLNQECFPSVFSATDVEIRRAVCGNSPLP